MSGILSAFIGRVAGVVTDAYFNLVTLLLPGNGTNGAQNNTFLDSSSNNFTITRNGNTTQGTFSPFSQTGWSNFFDGSGDYLSNTSTALITNAVSTFTVESWVCFTATPPASGNFISSFCTLDGQPTGPTNYLSFGPLNDGKLYLFWFDGSVKYAAGGTALALNTWYHIACVVNSNAIQFYVNGVAETMSGTTTLTNRSGSQGNFAVGSSSAGQITGYISNFRVTTTAVYTSAFTPSTTALTNITNTKLLTCQSNRFVDNSSNAYTLTVNGTPSVQAFSPFAPTAAYSAATVGGSGYFDGTGDYLSPPDNTAFSGIGSNDWTVEAWVYTGSSASQTIFTISGSSSAFAAIRLELSATANQMYLLCSLAGSAWDINYQAGTIPRNAWNHVAATRSGTSVRLYVNGAQVGVTQTLSGSLMSGTVNRIGIVSDNVNNPFNGYISNARYIRGTALYTGTTYTIPTAPFTAITNTQLLCNFTNAGITDATAKNVLETVGNAQISTTQSKFGGSSMYFDGTGDYLVVGNMSTNPNLALLSSDFTIEFWYYPLNTNIHATLNNLDDNAGNGSLWILLNGTFSGGSKVQFGYNTGGANGNVLFGTGTFTTNQWHHIAICRSGSNLRCFINGTQEGSTSTALGTSSIVAYNRNLVIGATLSAGSYTAYNLNGYLDDFRVTKFARYTTNFTAPTSAFALQ